MADITATNSDVSAPDRFRADPAAFIEQFIKDYVRTSPANRLEAFGGTPIFEEPLVSFADGDDPLFAEYKTIIGDFHLTPREALTRHLVATRGEPAPDLPTVSVVSWVMPTAKETRLANRRETVGPSLRWNHTRWRGQAFIFELSRAVVAVLESLGRRAVAPEMTPFFERFTLANGPASSWSQRHVAYAAGLGTFGFSDGFITPKGLAMRLGSVVTDIALPAAIRPYPNHTANCLFYTTGACQRCVERCPTDALISDGHNKPRCQATLYEDQRPWLDGAYGPGYIGDYAGCGLCQTKVPCEAGIPQIPRRTK